MREQGILVAKGQYVGFVDGDDEITPDMYEKLIKNAVTYDAQISQCGILYCFYDGRQKQMHGTGKLTVYDWQKGCAALLRGTEMEPSLCNKIYHASIIRNSCLDPSIINNEDMLRNIVLFDRTKQSVMEDFCGYLYWRRQESMSNNHKAVENGKNILRARKLIYTYVPKELKAEALLNYLYGALNTYNSLIGNREKNADILRDQCRRIMEAGVKKVEHVSGKFRLKVFFILHMPFIYDAAQRENVHWRKKRIRRQAEQAHRAVSLREGTIS